MHPSLYTSNDVYTRFFMKLKPNLQAEYKSVVPTSDNQGRRGFELLDGADLQKLPLQFWERRSALGDIIYCEWQAHVKEVEAQLANNKPQVSVPSPKPSVIKPNPKSNTEQPWRQVMTRSSDQASIRPSRAVGPQAVPGPKYEHVKLFLFVPPLSNLNRGDMERLITDAFLRKQLARLPLAFDWSRNGNTW